MIEYKGYIGYVEFDDDNNIFHGEVINTRDVITFQGQSVKELRKAMRDSIDVYLSICAKRGKEPSKPFSGKFLLRLKPEEHRQIYLAARLAGESLNKWIARVLIDTANHQMQAG